MPSVQSPPTRSRRLPVKARVALPAVVAILAFAGVACAPPGSPGSGYTGDTVGAVNQDRAAAGLAPLAWDKQLGILAGAWANHLAATGTIQHTDLGGVMNLPYMRGWWTMGENLLVGGAMSGGAAEDAWMNSSGHRANILNPNFNHIGVAATRDASGRWWYVAEFGAR
jgi:uncharacterized protein YkwD